MLAWDHNAYYRGRLIDAVPVGASRVLEVGCGVGALAAELAGRAVHVDALDRDVVMVAAARRRAPVNVTVRHGDVMAGQLPVGCYDAVVSMSVLHHLPLRPALQRMAALLRPGGVLAAVAVPRVDLPREVPTEAAATVWHHAVGAALGITGGRWPEGLGREPDHDQMPVREPQLTTRQVRAVAADVLPGVQVRRLLLWRYLLVWHVPAERDR